MVTNFIIRVTASIFFIEGSIQVKWDKSLSPKLKIQRPNCNWVPMNHNTLDSHYKSRTELNWIWLSWTEFFKYSRRARQFELIDPNRNSNFITSTDYSTQTFNSMSRDKALHNTFNQDLGQIQDSQHFYDSNHEWFFLPPCNSKFSCIYSISDPSHTMFALRNMSEICIRLRERIYFYKVANFTRQRADLNSQPTQMGTLDSSSRHAKLWEPRVFSFDFRL